jgi:hypothetical protein
MLFEELKKTWASLEENYQIFVEKKNKAAARRARKAASQLKKLLTPFKQETMTMEKKMSKK